MRKSIDITLFGTEAELTALFSYEKEAQGSQLTSLEDYIAHAINQTLVRDGFFGAWAQVLKQENGPYVLKMYSPHHDLGIYKDVIPAFLDAGGTGLSIFNDVKAKIPPANRAQMRFLLPAGLSMVNTRSVQLLHFPPLETLVYQDYLYSPTNRRWENLLGYNHLNRNHIPELETIVDCVPIAAPGDDMKGIQPFNNSFTPYVKKMLAARLMIRNNIPVVAYGEPVMDWLKIAYPGQISATLTPLSLVELDILETGVKTPVLCANHPSKYLYYTDDHKKEDFEKKKEMMTQDLIAAGWQVKMVQEPGSSPSRVLDEMKHRWVNNPQVLDIMIQEDEAYGYKLTGWSNTLHTAQI
jgi:hypothetical protein